MKSYQDIGLDVRLRATESLVFRERKFRTALQRDYQDEETAFAPRTFQSRGTVLVTLGGLTEFRDATGGTVIFTYDPDTGTVTIAGGVVAEQTLNLGTITNSALSGTSRQLGTFTNSGTITGGIINPGTTTSGVFNTITIGTPDSVGGTFRNATFGGTAGTINSVTMGTPDITGGSMDSAAFGTPTLQDATINGTLNLDVNSGSPALGGNGDFAIETHSGSAILVARVGGTSFYFTSAGTLA